MIIFKENVPLISKVTPVNFLSYHGNIDHEYECHRSVSGCFDTYYHRTTSLYDLLLSYCFRVVLLFFLDFCNAFLEIGESFQKLIYGKIYFLGCFTSVIRSENIDFREKAKIATTCIHRRICIILEVYVLYALSYKHVRDGQRCLLYFRYYAPKSRENMCTLLFHKQNDIFKARGLNFRYVINFYQQTRQFSFSYLKDYRYYKASKSSMDVSVSNLIHALLVSCVIFSNRLWVFDKPLGSKYQEVWDFLVTREENIVYS